jgi:hypothetical protein
MNQSQKKSNVKNLRSIAHCYNLFFKDTIPEDKFKTKKTLLFELKEKYDRNMKNKKCLIHESKSCAKCNNNIYKKHNQVGGNMSSQFFRKQQPMSLGVINHSPQSTNTSSNVPKKSESSSITSTIERMFSNPTFAMYMPDSIKEFQGKMLGIDLLNQLPYQTNIPDWILEWCSRRGNCKNCKKKVIQKSILDKLNKSLENEVNANSKTINSQDKETNTTRNQNELHQFMQMQQMQQMQQMTQNRQPHVQPQQQTQEQQPHGQPPPQQTKPKKQPQTQPKKQPQTQQTYKNKHITKITRVGQNVR